MGCFNSKLSPCGPLEYLSRSQQQAKSLSSPVTTASLPDGLPTEQSLQGVRLYGVASCGEAALLCSRLVIARGHILAAVFEGHISPSAAEYCRSHCWEAFVQASASWQQAPAAAALRALDRGFLTSSKHSMEARLSSGCSATLVHIDLAARTVTVATVGAHGAVGLGSNVAVQGADATGSATALPTATGAGLNASRRGQAGGSRVGKQRRHLIGSEAPQEKGQEGVCGRGQQPAAAGLWQPRPLSRFVTLEAPSAECRRGLSGLVDLVQSAMAPATDPITAATAQTVASAPESFQTGSTSGISALSRRGGVGSQPPPLGSPQALGFGCAKDAVLVSAFESADAVSGVVPGGAVRAHAPATPHAHALVQPPGSSRFAAISRLHCGCDVRVTSRALAAGDECLVLLGGCGGAGGRAAASTRPGAGFSNGGGSSSGAGGPGDNSGNVAAAARSVLGGGGITYSGSSALAPQPALCGPAGALSAADAVTLAHEMGAAGAALGGAGGHGGGGGGLPLTTAGLTRENRFVVLYDSYDSEAAVAAAVAAGVQPPPEVAAAAGPSQAGNRSAQAVASYAVAAAVRNRGMEWLFRGAGAPVPATPPPSAACITIWLDWGSETAGDGSGAGNHGAMTSLYGTPPPPPSPAALRWEVLRAYCRFLIARRRRIATAWHSLAATALMGPPSQPLPVSGGNAAVLAAGVGGTPSWLPAQIPALAAAAAAGAGGPAGSQESVTGGGTAASGIHTASFTSRAPVMMEFVEELPTPAPSVTMVAGRNPQARTVPGAPLDNGPAMTSSSAHTGGGAGGTSTSGAGMCTAAANAAAATLDESHTHSASTAAPYGISGLVVQPMGSSEEVDIHTVGDERAASIASAAAAGSVGAAVAGTGGGARGPAQAQLSQRSFVKPYGSVLARRAEALGLRSSHSTPDLQNLVAAARTPTDSPRWPQAYRSDGGSDSAAEVAAADQAMAHEAEAVAYAQGSAYYNSQASLAASAASAASTAAAANGGGAGATGGSGSHFDWSLIMASVNPNSVPNRPLNSAGHTPIPSTAVNRLPPQGFSPEGAGGDPQAAASGGYLPISGGGSFRRCQAATPPPLPHSPLASGLEAVYGTRGTASATAGSGRSSQDGGGGGGCSGGSRGVPVSLDMQPPPGVLLGGGSVHSDCDTADAEGEVELISEDLPQLRIESTAELAALMAEIIITEDGEVVRTGSGGGGLPSPYSGRSHGHHHGVHHKGSRTLSRQGSRGWQPRLAIVREDAREANTSTSCSQLLPGDGIRFTAITEERGSSQGSSRSGERALQGSSGGSNTSRHSRLASNSNSNGTASIGTASNGSPNGSVEEQLAALNGEAAAAILVPPSVPPSRPRRIQPAAAAGADTDAYADAAGGSPVRLPATAVSEVSHSPWIHSGADSDGAADALGPAPGPGLSLIMPASQMQYRHQHQQLFDQLPASLTPSLTSPPQLPLPPRMDAINLRAAAVAAVTDASASAADPGGAGQSLTEASVRAESCSRERSAVAEAASSAAGADAALAGAIGCTVGAPAQLVPLGVVPPVVAVPAAAAALALTAPAPLPTEKDGALADVLAVGRGGGGKAAAASGGGGEGRDAAAGDLHEHDSAVDVVRLRPNLSMVGRSRSASATRPVQLSHLRHLLYPGSLQFRGDAHHGQGAGGGDGGGEAATPLAHTAPAQRSPADAVQPPPQTAAMPRARHLYGLSEAAPPLAVAHSAARSYCSATATAAAPSPAPQVVYDAAAAGVGNTATTLDRSWSMGSTSGLCSLLHSTMSKSSMTVATSTAVQTPGCNSAHCSGGRLPTVNIANISLPPPPPPLPPLPLQTQFHAAATALPAAPPVAAAVAMPAAAMRVLSRSMSASHPEPSSDSGPSSAIAAAVDAAAATVLPSLPADCATPAAAALDDSSQSVTLHAPRFAGWEPHSAGSAAASSSKCVHAAAPISDGNGAAGAEGSGIAADGGSSCGCCCPCGECSLVFADVAAGTSGTSPVHRPQFTKIGSQPQHYHQQYHTLQQQRSSCLLPTRLSRPGFAGGDPTFGSPSAMEGRDANAGSPQGLPAAAAVVAPSASRSPEISSALALGTAASGHLAPSAGLSRALGGSLYGGGGGPQGSSLADAAIAYDDGAVNNRSSNISRSDASVWTSTSAWTASTGRTTDVMMVLGGSNRRVLMGTMGGGGGGGGSSALMLHTGLAVAGGGGAGAGGAGDTSGLLAYNAVCSSASGLLMTADAGAPGSSTQLLMQMAPPPGAFGALGGYGGAGTVWPGSNGQASSQLFCSPRYGAFFGGGPAPVGGGGVAIGGEGSLHQGQLMAALAAQARAHHSAFYGASPTDSPPFLQHHHQQHMQAVCGVEGRGGGPVAERPVGHHTALIAPPASRGAPATPQAGGPAGGSTTTGHLHQQPAGPGIFDSMSSQAALYGHHHHHHPEGVLDSGCYLLAGGSTSNNNGQP